MIKRKLRGLLLACLAVAATLVATEAPAHAITNLTIGNTWKPDEMSTRQPHYPNAEVSRVFFTGTQCPTWSDSRIQYMIAHNIIPFVSFKQYDTSCLVNFANAMPANVPWVFTTWYHEGEANMDATTWKTRQLAMWNAVKNLPVHTAGRFKYMSVQTRQWTENNHRSYGTYWCGCGDLFAVDMYVNSWDNAYPSAATFTSQTIAFANSIGYPIFYPELGAIRMPSDPSDTGRAAFINDMAALMRANSRISGVIWWDAIGTPAADGTQRDFSLNQVNGYNDPAAVAWNAALAAS